MSTPPAVPTSDAGLAALQAQLQQLQLTQAGLQSQWNRLKAQLDQMLRNDPARPQVQQQWADVGIQNVQVEGNIAAIQARVAAMKSLPIAPQATYTTATIPFGIVSGLADPAMSLVALVLLFPLSIAWAGRILRRPPHPIGSLVPDVATRLEQIERAVDTVAIEVERISEGQRFVTRVIAGWPGNAAP